MNVFVPTAYRTSEVEIMDDFLLEGDELREALDKIAKINQLLGGNAVTLSGIEKLLKKCDVSKTIRIIDLGCGNGDMLRAIAHFGKKNALHLDLLGIDANAYTIAHATQLSLNFNTIRYSCENIFDPSFKQKKADIFLCTLTLHHFQDDEIVTLLQMLYANTNLGIVINDLHRSALAYRLFQAVCFVFRLNRMSRQDGLTSILRGFKKDELFVFSKKIHPKHFSVRWKWAFRYQWIISKL